MKKTVLRRFLILLLFCLVTTPAFANSWGLKADLLQAVMNDNRWNDYSTISHQQGDFAVMGSRYHNVLMRCKDGELFTYPLAVWQETDLPKVEKPQLKLLEDGKILCIRYGDWESYSFELNHCFDSYWTADALIQAYVKGLTFQRDGYGFIVSDGEQEVYWQRNVLLEDFNIKLFPRSIEEVKHLNRMYAVLASSDRLGTNLEGQLIHGNGKGSAPVYSAPFGDSAWRAAKGKAAVGLSGDYWQLGTYINENGTPYVKIRYEVSERTHRIGYVWASDLGTKISLGENQMPQMIHVPLESRADTWLTDDPLVSQYQQFYVPPGTSLICMGSYGKDYAYVAGEVKNGSFVDGGKVITEGDQIVWGYVPLRDLAISSEALWRNTIEWDAMAQFAGHWYFAAGGVGIADHLMLYADGTWEGFTDELSGGTWQLTRYNAADNLYWMNVPYEMTFTRDNGTVRTLGFQPEEDGSCFSLLYWEGSGGYQRSSEPFPHSVANDNG